MKFISNPSKVEINKEAPNTVKDYKLFQNYPNPFNTSTVIPCYLPSLGFVTLKIYNQLGQKVRTLMFEWKSVGSFQMVWDGRDEFNKLVPSGVYFYQVKSNNFSNTKKAVILR